MCLCVVKSKILDDTPNIIFYLYYMNMGFSKSSLPAHWSENMVQETIDQLNKDLFSYGHHIEPIADFSNAYIDILQQLSAILQHVTPAKLQTLLYKVDIPETTFRRLQTQKMPKQNYFLTLSGLMIEREFKKVYLRKMLSK